VSLKHEADVRVIEVRHSGILRAPKEVLPTTKVIQIHGMIQAADEAAL